MKLTLEIKGGKKLWLPILIGGLVLIIIFLAYLKLTSTNPLPANIKKQVSFKVIYPTGSAKVDSASYKYQSDQKSLSFMAADYGTNIVFTEQPAPSTLGLGSQIYYQALGLHPYAQFSNKLGPVALAKFYQHGNLQPLGQSAILASGSTLLIAHSQKDLTNEQWKSLFDSLKITK